MAPEQIHFGESHPEPSADESAVDMAKEQDRVNEEWVADKQQEYDDLLTMLPSLDFTNVAALLDWLCALERPTNEYGVGTREDEVLATFAEHGYQPGAKIDDAYHGDDPESVARYLIGQALSGLQRGGFIPQEIHHFAADWKKKLGAK